MAIAARFRPQTFIWIDEGSPVALADGESWRSPILDLNRSASGAFAVDLRINDASGGSADAVVTIHGGNFHSSVDGTPRTELPDTGATGLPSFANLDLGVDRLVNIENLRSALGQLKITASGGGISIVHAVVRVST